MRWKKLNNRREHRARREMLEMQHEQEQRRHTLVSTPRQIEAPQQQQPEASNVKGFLIAGGSLAALGFIAFLKGRADR